jgi:valyl-tRNA synthetase
MGHVLNNTIQDVVVRYKRMTGVPTLWIPGVDHAGIATQNVVEKQLAKEGKSRYDVGREKLVQLIWKWKEEKGGRIIEQLKQLGASCDWDRQRFTMDEKLSEAVKEVFIRLYEKGLIYKGKRIINWCPRCHTALANDEVDHEDEKGYLWHIRYPFTDGSGYLVVATTRPETMLGDTAVAVNPNDERYKNIVGKTVKLPLTEREIPVIADDYVDMEFGSGCVKITPAHDPNDFEVGNRHNLPRLLVIDDYGIMNENAGKEFEGLDRFEARKKIVEKLKEAGLLDKIEEHEHSVGHCYRCNTVIEPYLSDQWFVKMKPLAEPAIKVVKEGKIEFLPKRWTKIYYNWMENIQDWCISRQIWWGHRIPVYYCEKCGEKVVAKEMPEVCPKCGHTGLVQDEDVLDTWFSSWLWPFSTLGWPEKTEELDYFLPTNLLVTAPGIIFFWVARMIMSTLEFVDKIPFEKVLLHGMVLDEQGRKMSKSLGNSPDPIDIIEEYGADALRFSMIFNTPQGQDSYYSNSIVETGRNFANKIWNAYRYIMTNAENIKGLPEKTALKTDLADKWIYSRLNSVIEKVTENFEKYRLNDAASILMEFIWKEFCSWYLELSKDKIYNGDKEEKLTAKYILLDVLQNSIRLIQPLMPFIAEEIWQNLKSVFPIDEESVIIAKYPEFDASMVDKTVENKMSLIQEAITVIRGLRKQMNISPANEVNILIESEKENAFLLENKKYFTKLAKVKDLKVQKSIEKPKSYIAGIASELKIYMPLSGVIDTEKEKKRLSKQAEKLSKELMSIERKLNNEKFISKAPEHIVEKEKEKFNEVKEKLEKISEIIQNL